MIGGLSEAPGEIDPELGAPVPHLHRMGPDGRYLMTWDDNRRRLWIRDVAAKTSRAIRVAGLRGSVKTMRWLRDSSGAVFLTGRNAYVARFDLADATDDATRASSIFGRRTLPREPVAVRNVLNGLVIMTEEGWHPEYDEPLRHVYHVRITDNRVGPPVRFTPKDGRLDSMSVRAGGRVVVSMRDDYDADTLRTLRVFANGTAKELSRRICASVSECRVVNWTPGTRKLVYALADGQVVIAGRTGDEDDIVVEVAGLAPHDGVHTLWLSPDESRLLASGPEEIVMLNASNGEEIWHWEAPDQAIVSARFDTDGSVLATAGRGAYRLRSGRAKKLFQTRMKAPGEDDVMLISREVVLDDLIPLGDGSIAYSVVRSRIVEEFDHYEEDEDYAEEE